jgi:hypothetical protein
MSKAFFLYVTFAVGGMFMAWLSLSLNCSHFNVAGMCQDLERSIELNTIEGLSLKNCFRLGELSKEICSRLNIASWFGVIFGLVAACIGAKHAVKVYVNKQWKNENI